MTAEHAQAEENSPEESLVNLHIGRRLRRRRRIMGLTQLALGNAVNIKFQQVQKYECAANRISAARLYTLATALHVPVQYFFEGLPNGSGQAERTALENEDDVLASGEAQEVLELYYRLPERARRRLVSFMKALQEESTEST